MRKSILKSLIVILSLLVFSGGERSYAHSRVSISLFYSSLSPYGVWFEYRDYGLCWRPTVVEVGWRPYTYGHWIWTDYGWTWVSDYEWGWAPFHYGRWIYDDHNGWIWVPDDVWGPAWVEWRTSDAYIGWAPLPPAARFYFSIGFSFGSYAIPYFGWSFTYSNSFLGPKIILLPVRRNVVILRETRFVRGVRSWGHNRVYNEGPAVSFVERATGGHIRKAQVVENRDFGQRRGNRLEGDRFYVYRPELERRNQKRSAVEQDRESLRNFQERFSTGRGENERSGRSRDREAQQRRPEDLDLRSRERKELEFRNEDMSGRNHARENFSAPRPDRERPMRMDERGRPETRIESRDAGRSRQEVRDRGERRGRER